MVGQVGLDKIKRGRAGPEQFRSAACHPPSLPLSPHRSALPLTTCCRTTPVMHSPHPLPPTPPSHSPHSPDVVKGLLRHPRHALQRAALTLFNALGVAAVQHRGHGCSNDDDGAHGGQAPGQAVQDDYRAAGLQQGTRATVSRHIAATCRG